MEKKTQVKNQQKAMRRNKTEEMMSRTVQKQIFLSVEKGKFGNMKRNYRIT